QRMAYFSPDGKLILTADAKGKAELWEALDGKAHGTAMQHPQPVCGANFSLDGRSLWTACEDTVLRQWDVETGQILATHRDPAGLALAAFDRYGRAALFYGAGKYVQLRDLTTGVEQGPLLSHPTLTIRTIIINAEGSIAVTTGFDRTTRLWDGVTGRPLGP